MAKSKLSVIVSILVCASMVLVGCPEVEETNEPTPASFSVSNICCEPAEVLAGETVAVSVFVSNTDFWWR